MLVTPMLACNALTGIEAYGTNPGLDTPETLDLSDTQEIETSNDTRLDALEIDTSKVQIDTDISTETTAETTEMIDATDAGCFVIDTICTSNVQCCTGVCNESASPRRCHPGIGGACKWLGVSCITNIDCCTARCDKGKCAAASG